MYRIRRHSETRAEKLLKLLADGRQHTTGELTKRIGHTFAGAVFTLRARGYVIDRRPHATRDRQHEYKLVKKPVRRSHSL